MSSAGCRGFWAWAVLACCALATSACNTRPSELPGTEPPSDGEAPTEAPPPPPEQPRSQVSELEALDLDLQQANKHLEEQLRRKQSEHYRAATEGRSEGEQKTPNKPVAPPKKKPNIAQGGATEKPPSADPAVPERDKDAEATDRPVGVRGSPCDLACRALKSMERSAQRICAIAGDSSERCQKARRTVARANERVREAGCQCTRGSKELMSLASRVFPHEIICGG